MRIDQEHLTGDREKFRRDLERHQKLIDAIETISPFIQPLSDHGLQLDWGKVDAVLGSEEDAKRIADAPDGKMIILSPPINPFYPKGEW